MKFKFWILSFLAGLSVIALARDFKSSDGEKTITGKFVRYSSGTGQVTLRLDTGPDLVAPANKFSKEDYNYFMEQQKSAEKKTAIQVEVDRKSAGSVTELRGNIEYKSKKYSLALAVRNTSAFDFENLTLNYWVVVDRDNKGKTETQILKGTKSIPALAAKADVEVECPEIKLTQGAISKCKTGCPKVAAEAAKVDNDRIVGTKIIITDGQSDVLYEKSSCNRVEVIMHK